MKKNGYTVYQIFNDKSELIEFLRDATDHKKIKRSQLQACSMSECEHTDPEHNMRIQHVMCACCEKCKLRFRVKTCQLNGNIEVSRSHQEYCLQKGEEVMEKAKELRGKLG